MHTRALHLKKLGWVRIQPLRNGDTQTVAHLFERLSDASRVRRFNTAKPRFSKRELDMLATVDGHCHALVAWVEGDSEPAGFAQLVRDHDHWTHAEIAFVVADDYHGRGIGSALVDQLAADARAAGITHLTALVQTSNTAALALVNRVSQPLDVRVDGPETSLLAVLTTG